MTPAELSAHLSGPKPPCLLDVREPWEHERAALPHSRLIPLGELALRVDEIEDWRDAEIVVYCHHGIRSAQAIALLRAGGFTKLHNLSGGIDRWSEQVDPTLPKY